MGLFSDLYNNVVGEYADKTAYMDPTIGVKYTYREFDSYVRRLAAKLASSGVKKGDVCVLAMPHDVHYIAVAHACLLSGICYVPLADTYPLERINMIKEDSAAKMVLKEDFIEDADSYNEVEEFPDLSPDDLSLIIYTSGSTGRPKGVMHNHIGLSKAIERYEKIMNFANNDIYGSNAPFYFVVHMQDVFSAFMHGVTTVLIPEELRGDPDGLAGCIDRYGITMTYIAPKVLKYFKKKGTSLRRALTGSERVSNLYTEDFQIVNGYGMSETASGVLMFLLDRNYDNTPIGRPAGDEVFYVVDENGNIVKQGELCIAGDLAVGYRNLDEQTAETFVKNPFYEEDGYETLLHTGDLVKRLPSGDILYVNRKDWMIKINGQRVEPGEIEAAIAGMDSINEACVKDFNRPDGQTIITAYYVTKDGKDLDEELIKNELSKSLPEYMIPAYCVRLDKLPVNANGKLDRKALKAPELSEYSSEYAAPETRDQESICQVYGEILGISRVGIDDDFFSLGGDSIKTLVLQNRLAHYGITKSDIFAAHTPRKLAQYIKTDNKKSAVLSDYADKKPEDNEAFPLTESQISIYLDSSDPDRATIYNNVVGLFLPDEGNPDDACDRLRSACETVINSYPILKCHVEEIDGVPSFVYDSSVSISATYIETEETDRDKLARDFIAPHDLAKAPLIRACIYKNPEGLFLISDIHHILCDGTSMSLLVDNISRVYEGGELRTEKVTNLSLARYADENLAEVKKADNDFYRNMLDGMDGDTEVYGDDNPSLSELSGRSGLYTNLLSSLNEDIQAHITDVVRHYGVTESTVFIGAYAYMLRLLSGQKKVLLFAGENGRDDSLLADTFGMMVHNIPVLADVNEESMCVDYLKDMQKRFFECVAHDGAAFSELLSEYHIRPDYSFVYQGDMLSGAMMDGRYIPLEIYKPQDAMDKLTLHVLKQPGGDYQLRFEYDAGLYTEDTIRRITALYARIVYGLLEDKRLCDITLVGAEDIAEQEAHNATERDYEITDIVTLFKRMVKLHPDNNAVFYKGEMLSYREVDEISDRIAGFLRNKGVGAGKVVSILIPRSTYMVTASLGVLKTGAAYQPLDPSYPSERLTFMMQDADAAYLIADESLLGSVPEYRGEVLLIDDIDKLPPGEHVTNGPDKDSLFILLYTSGSTGMPKGVKILHRNLANFCGWYREFYELDETSKVAAYASYGFDADMMDLYPALTTGASVYIIEEEIRLDLLALETYFNENAITHSFMTTQVGRQFYTMVSHRSLKFLSTGGEKLVPLSPIDSAPPFYNVYGPTECTILTTAKRMDRLYDRVPIGKPLANYKVYVRDEYGRQLPALVPGEMLISGAGVSAGYLNRDDLTEKVFIKNEFTDEPGYERAYRSGDVVRLLANGEVDFIGRNDGQVKVRGFRIELTEVEGIIREFPGINDATVQAFEDDATGEKYIAAYIVSDDTIDISALNDFIRSEKPPYMVPAVTMQIDAIPLNQNQKVNKKALPKPERQQIEKIEPKTDMQKQIFDCMADVVGHTDFGITTDFAEAGLSSIGSIKLNASLSKTFDMVFTTRDLKECNTIEKLEAYILSVKKGGKSHEADFSVRPVYDLTKTQEGVYVECVADPDTCVYNIPILLEIDKELDTDRLKKAIVAAVDAHPFIKTRLFLNDDGDVRMRRMDADYSFDEASVEVITAPSIEDIKDELVKPFKLIGGKLYRIKIIEADKRYLFIEMHHIISDGTSMSIFLNDISKAYSGEELAAEEYTGYEVVLNEQHIRTAEKLEETKRYYERLLDEAETQSLPVGDIADGTAGNNIDGTASNNSDCLAGDITDNVSDGRQAEGAGMYESDGSYISAGEVREFYDKNGLSMNAFFSAVFGHMLNAYLNTESVVFAGIYNGRSDSRLMDTVAMLVKTIPIVAGTKAGETVTGHVKDMGIQLTDTQARDLYSFAEVSRQMGVNADVMFAYQGDDFTFDTFCGRPASMIALELGAAKAPLNVNIFIQGDNIHYSFEYDRAHYSDDYIRTMKESLDHAVSRMPVSERMSDISFVTDKMKDELKGFNSTDAVVESDLAPYLMEKAAAKWADKTAVISGSGSVSITYKELNSRANRIANTLIDKGIGRGKRVGLYMERTEDVYAVRQGIMKAGAAFVSLEPDYPDDRISFIIEDAGLASVITTKELYAERKALFDGITEIIDIEAVYASDVSDNMPAKLKLREDDPAYCIYTSGSTGNPKGVEITHKNLRNLLSYNDKNTLAHAYVDNSTVFLALAAITFDVSIIEEMMPLYHGKTVVMATDDEIHNPMLLLDTMKKTGVDMMKCTPSYMLSILDVQSEGGIWEQLKAVILGAEPFPKGMYEKLKGAGFKGIIYNSYGPTETCVSVSIGELDGSYVTIGGPSSNTRFYIRDRFGNILPKYMRGELVIAGDCVGAGYIGMPEKTKEVYITLSDNDKKLPAYRSGDIAYFNNNGQIMHCGRNDNQVKIRGLRVELDGIENTMNTYPGIERSVVMVLGEGDGKYLVGYYVAKHPVDEASLSEHLRKTLTAYMVPGVYVYLEELPLTVNGKVNKKALPKPADKKKTVSGRKAENDLQRQLCEMFAHALGVEEIGIDEDFFEAGGTSMLASKVAMSAMVKGLPIAYKDVFAYPTVAAMEKHINGADTKKEHISGSSADTGKEHSSNSNGTDANKETEIAGLTSLCRKQINDLEDDEIRQVLKYNTMSYIDEIETGELGDILLTGATGFLGIHVLHHLIEKEQGKIICLIRKGRAKSAEIRLKSMLVFYFDDSYDELFEDGRIEVVDGDITDRDIVLAQKELSFDTVINCAACVKHFAKDDILTRVNVTGVKNLVELCEEKKALLIQISTVSVAGENVDHFLPDTTVMKEDMLYFGQDLSNQYVRSKYDAEEAVLKSIAKGKLRAKIIRVGNLMSRDSDGEFQANAITSGFMRNLRGYAVIGAYPVSEMARPVEFSPIDLVAEAVVALAKTSDKFTVFHAVNGHWIEMGDIIAVMNMADIPVEVVSDKEFGNRLTEALQDENKNMLVSGLISYLSADTDTVRSYVAEDHTFTKNVLYHLGYRWPLTDERYLKLTMESLITLGFFDGALDD